MKSASTIRNCSYILLVLIIVGSLVSGYLSLNNPIISLVIIAGGVFIGIMINALCQGFADLIDNSYAVALRVNGVDLSKQTDKSSGDVAFHETARTEQEKEEKKAIAGEWLEKGLISPEEYRGMADSGNE